MIQDDDINIPPPFVVFSLPRSRSVWLTHFLSYPPFQCGHDVAVYCESIDDFVRMFSSGMVGTCETGAVSAWRVIREEIPEVKFVVIKRPVKEVIASLNKLGVAPSFGHLSDMVNMLENVASLNGSLAVDYDELDSPVACRRIFEFCLGIPFDWEWWEYYSQFNIQVDVRRQIELINKNAPRLMRLKKEVEMRSSGMSVRELN
jgi:hypothetical protein